jgi:hypothetical protein
MGISKYISGDRSPKALNTTNSERVIGGTAGALLYQGGVGSTLFAPIGSNGQLLQSNGTSAPSWSGFSALSSTPSFVMVNSSGIAFTSTDGTTWTQRIPPTTLGVQGMTYGSGVFVGVRLFSDSVYYSTDGITWTVLAGALGSGSSGGITYGNGIFVAPVGSGSARTSTNGITWTARTLPEGSIAGAGAYGNGNLVLMGGNIFGGSSVSAYSTNGITWASSAMPSSQRWSSVAFGQSKFVAVSNSGTGVGATSTNGITWTAVSLPANSSWESVAFGNNVFVAVNTSNQYARSTDGITWTTASASGNHYGITFGYGRFVAGGSNGSSTSTDGITWTYTSSGGLFSVISGIVFVPSVSVRKELTPDITEPISSTAYTVSPSEGWVNLNTPAACVLTLPPAPNNKYLALTIRQTSAFAVTSATSNVVPLTSQTPGTAILSGSGKYAKLVSDGINWIIMEGN